MRAGPPIVGNDGHVDNNALWNRGLPGDSLTRPELDQTCIRQALVPLAYAYTGTMILKAKVLGSGALNYFQILKGPHEWTDAVVWKLSLCRAKPATLNSKPISFDYIFNIKFDRK